MNSERRRRRELATLVPDAFISLAPAEREASDYVLAGADPGLEQHAVDDGVALRGRAPRGLLAHQQEAAGIRIQPLAGGGEEASGSLSGLSRLHEIKIGAVPIFLSPAPRTASSSP